MEGSTAVPPCVLVAMSGADAGETHTVGFDAVVVGRSLEAAIRIESDSVSRFHARLARDSQGVVVVSDLQSSNGTFVNGQRVDASVPLRTGDRVRFGPRSAFLVQYEAPGLTRDTVEVSATPGTDDSPTQVLATRNQGRMHLAEGDYAQAIALFERALLSLERFDLAAPEDLGELLTDLARCHLALDDRPAALSYLERATELLARTTSAERSLVRAKFVLAQAVFPTRPQDALALLRGAANALEPNDALRRELEAWVSIRTGAIP